MVIKWSVFDVIILKNSRYYYLNYLLNLLAIKRVKNIPTHNFKREELPVQVRKIDHKNHYDFTQRHRHSYFEIILFIKGEGNQLIDFNAYEVKSNT